MINNFTGKAVYHLTFSIKTESTLFSGSLARLVYRTFVKDIINKSKQRIIISHYDEDSLNNHVNNLYPQTYTELNLRNIKAGRLRTPKINELPVDIYNKICKGKCISIVQYTLDGEFIGTYPSISHAVKKYNMSFSSIIKALKYPNRTCCGFIWKKVNAEEKLTSPKLL
ncbi:NUMOD1 domain-containing DNA-binding protein [Apibacter sp. HY039]|uniref:NUMOD1 domain-containing DNA-binding protein n=1 Tax=Apibacter sp. HY039 TaxID=2501476 RepID=UPI000FEB6695|nr:NUMOD1 domain-containing DNA-binding protein [Apibacter sp. HY039]